MSLVQIRIVGLSDGCGLTLAIIQASETEQEKNVLDRLQWILMCWRTLPGPSVP